MKKSSVLIGISLVLLSACSFGGNEGNGDQESSGSSSSAENTTNETRNVLYSGTVRSAGVTIFMQGTHKLILEDGRFILLESDTIELSDYIGDEVEVFGSVRPTVEEGGLIMRVERVTTNASSSSESSESSSSSITSEASVASEASASSETSESSASSKSSSTATIPTGSTWEGSAELQAKADTMARDDMAASNWTQEYCSSHVLFCIPVHRNWWFTSFGATASTFWHVEIGPVQISNLGEGPLSVNLVSGSIESSGASDGEVRVQNGTATGYKAWDSTRHFEIVGPSNLEDAIRYLTGKLRKTEG